jgi:hypothetical protein
MPTMSLYVFERSDASLAGRFYQNHIGHGTAPDSWAWATISNLPQYHGALAWERPDDEVAIDLHAQANGTVALAAIDGNLSSPLSRSGEVRTTYVPWDRVPSEVRASNPSLHEPWALLGQIVIPFHASTPWYCSDADGTIHYYVFFSLDGEGRPTARIEGWYWEHDGAGLCNGALRDGLDEGVPAAIPTLQNLLSLGLSAAAGEQRFGMLYFLPGTGTRSGFSEDDADRRVALALVPA